MFKDWRIFRRTLYFILFLLSVLILAFLAGCGGSANIPSASILTIGQVTLMWEDVPGAATYNLYLSTAPGVTVMNSYRISDVTNPITITDLEPGNTYYFVVTVLDASGQHRKSNEISYKVVNTEGSI